MTDLPISADMVDVPAETMRALTFIGARPISGLEEISDSELHLAIRGCDHVTGSPAGEEQARKLAEVLLGSYPNHGSVGDVKIYSRAIISVFQGFPVSIGKSVVDRITKTKTFLPARAEVYQECERLMRSLTAARATAQSILKARDELKKQEAEEQARKDAREKFRRKHGNKSPLDVLADEEGISFGGHSKRKSNGS